MITLEGLTKRYGDRTAVAGLSLEIGAGEVCVLIGPSGCGKTTTLRMINRLVVPTSGKIFIGGRDTDGVDPVGLRRTIGYLVVVARQSRLQDDQEVRMLLMLSWQISAMLHSFRVDEDSKKQAARAVVMAEASQAKDDGRLPMTDHNTRIFVVAGSGAEARSVAEAIVRDAFHNVSFFDGSIANLGDLLDDA